MTPVLLWALQEGAAVDFRGRVYLACTLLFALLTGYLVWAHRRHAAARGEMERLERRMQELEGDEALRR